MARLIRLIKLEVDDRSPAVVRPAARECRLCVRQSLPGSVSWSSPDHKREEAFG